MRHRSREFEPSGVLRVAVVFVLTMSLLVASGCSGQQRAAPVDESLARVTLKRVLEHWKAGGAIDDLRAESPEVVVQEELWYRGDRLIDFTIKDGRAVDANWFCEVELTVTSEAESKPKRQTVTYAVGTDPVLTVFHAML